MDSTQVSDRVSYAPDENSSIQIRLMSNRTPVSRDVRRRLKDLLNRMEMECLLRRESARCERNGNIFSVVMLGLSPDMQAGKMHRLAKVLCHRARATDEIGWFDQHRTLAILPDTPATGAREFVIDITRQAEEYDIPLFSRVLEYPHRATNNSHLTPGQECQAAADEIDREALKCLAGAGYEREGESDPESDGASNLAPLLVRPMPAWKRLFDLAIASVSLLFLSPLFLVIAAAIKLTDGGPVFFRQRRAGLGGKPFSICKFRTMIVDAEHKKSDLLHLNEQDGPAFKLKDDPRITSVGRLLRQTSVDELPQLWNVIRGEMSLVGPRPLPLEESEKCNVWQRRRVDVTPGLTCIWQVNGRSSVTFSEWARMDRTYINRRSFWHDLKLMFQTIPAVVRRRGAK
jgi:lipopolysaccharide/colanic/teichoic acid biosynthesis glycosyltransferase